MSYNKRKRRLSEKPGYQLPIETRQNVEKLFEKKFAYRKPSDDKWSLPVNKYSGQKTHVAQNNYAVDQLYSLNQPVAKNVDETASSNELFDQCEDTWKVLKDLWTEDKFIEMKNELNALKNNLNDKDMISWHQHTRSVNLASNIATEIQQNSRPELLTQAWCKFYEIVTTYLDLQGKEFLFSVHLCEAPGAFVTSLNHFMLSTEYEGDWDWIATTLNPYYEGNNNGHMISDDRLIRHTEDNWYFGMDNTGDLMTPKNLEGLKKLIGDWKVDLVTADGSIDCQGDPAEQEDVVSRLQHCEALTALQILSPGGDFVLKMFTMLECKAVSLMFLLNCVFEEVHVFKPCTSKSGNSEVYVICKNYIGIEDSDYLEHLSSVYFDQEPEGCLFSKHQIPASFLSQHTECVSSFKELQMASIQRNLDLYKKLSEEEVQVLEAEKQFCTEYFLQRYKIVPMVHDWKIMKYRKKPQNKTAATSKVAKYQKIASDRKNEGRFCGSFEDRMRQSELPWRQRVKDYETYSFQEEEFITWAENSHGLIHDTELEKFHTSSGVPVEKIESSRFCYGKLIQQTQEIIHNVKWVSQEGLVKRDEFLEQKVKKLMEFLAAHRNEKEKLPEGPEQDVKLRVDMPNINTVTEKSPVLSALENKLTRGPIVSAAQTNIEVQLYSICTKCLNQKFELNEQEELLSAVCSIMETCHQGGFVIIEMRSCLTRMTAGLVYLLYRCFNKIGFLSYHRNLLKQYLVCLHCNLCPVAQYNVKDYLRKFCSLKMAEMEFTKLEVVPVSFLIDDPEFCSFLQATNTRLLQSFVTSVVEEERTLLSENAGVT